MSGSISTWAIRYNEARIHALIAGVILWTGTAIVTFGSTGSRNLVDHLKSEDFVQIYTLAHAAFEGPYPTLRREAAFHQRQVELVPASDEDHYLPVYPPSAALIFRPLVALSYGWAALLWAAISIAAYGLTVWGAWRSQRLLLPDTGFIAAAAVAFPPFFLLVLHGQTTVIPLLGFFLCWLALERQRPISGGVALGLLTVKPQFALVLAAVLFLSFSWRVLLGFTLCVIGQACAVAFTMGTQAFDAYAETMSGISKIERLLEPDGWRMHSLRTLTRLIPQPAGDLIWACLSLLVIGAAVRVWRSHAPLAPRFGIILLATVLVNPHLFAYDAVVLVLPFIWLGGWVEATQACVRNGYWQAVYMISVLLLLPTALVMYIQASVLVMIWLFWRMTQALLAAE
jgi:hypothetical protein